MAKKTYNSFKHWIDTNYCNATLVISLQGTYPLVISIQGNDPQYHVPNNKEMLNILNDDFQILPPEMHQPIFPATKVLVGQEDEDIWICM